MGHEFVTLSRANLQIHEEIMEVETVAEFEAFRKRWCTPWDRTLSNLNDNPLLKAWVIRRWEEMKPRILLQWQLARIAWKSAADRESDLQFLSALD
jgi:hypothetical protein